MLLQPDEFVSEYKHEQSSEFPPLQVKTALDSAEIKLIELVGATSVTATKDALEADYAAKDNAIREAHGLLAFRRLLLTSKKIENGGIPEVEQDGDGNSTNRFEAYDKTQKRRADLLEEAKEVLSLYLVSSSPVGVVYRNSSATVTMRNEW